MLRGLIICPDTDLKDRLEDLLNQIGIVTIAKKLDRFPTQLQLVRMVRALAPDVIFVSMESTMLAFEIAREMRKNGPGVQIIGLSRVCDQQILMEAMRVGIKEFAALPFDRGRLSEGLRRIEEVVRERRSGNEGSSSIFSFIPAKAGVGASTVALNTALALSRSAEGKVLLSDLDLSAGMVRFMLRLENTYSMTDVAERSIELVEGLWPYMVTGFGSLDVLHSGKLNPEFDMEGAHVRQFMDFLRPRYDALYFDMSGNFESYSLETIHESKRIFLVCTPEAPALHLAREKYNYLDSLELADRVSIIMNRWPKTPAVSLQQIEEQLGLPVFATLPNDYDGVQKALAAGRNIEPTSNLGKQFSALAQTILKNEANAWRTSEPPAAKGRKFSDLFSAARLLLSE